MAGKRTKTAKLKILNIAVIAFSVYVIISFAIMQVDIQNRKKEIEAVNNQVKEQQYINDEYQSIIQSGLSDDYLVRLAREKLGFVFPDEQVFVDMNK